MTRINLVPVETLSDDHLRGEYKEITRIFTLSRKRLDSGKGLAETSKEYVLGSGHVCFFYNKIRWCINRYSDLANEMGNRSFNVNWDLVQEITYDAIELEDKYLETQDFHWKPTPEEIYLSMARLIRRSKMVRPIYEMEVGY